MNRHFQTYTAFKRACKKLVLDNGQEWNDIGTKGIESNQGDYIGDKDIAHIHINGVAYCEWDGECGTIEGLRES